MLQSWSTLSTLTARKAGCSSGTPKIISKNKSKSTVWFVCIAKFVFAYCRHHLWDLKISLNDILIWVLDRHGIKSSEQLSPVLWVINRYKISFPYWSMVWFFLSTSLPAQWVFLSPLHLTIISFSWSWLGITPPLFFSASLCVPRTSEKMIFFPWISHGVWTHTGLFPHVNVSEPLCLFLHLGLHQQEHGGVKLSVWIEKIWWNNSFYKVQRGQCGAFREHLSP